MWGKGITGLSSLCRLSCEAATKLAWETCGRRFRRVRDPCRTVLLLPLLAGIVVSRLSHHRPQRMDATHLICLRSGLPADTERSVF
jgi:hypothetical protein